MIAICAKHDAEDKGLVDEMMEQFNECPKRVVQIDRVGELRKGYIRPMKLRIEKRFWADWKNNNTRYKHKIKTHVKNTHKKHT